MNQRTGRNNCELVILLLEDSGVTNILALIINVLNCMKIHPIRFKGFHSKNLCASHCKCRWMTHSPCNVLSKKEGVQLNVVVFLFAVTPKCTWAHTIALSCTYWELCLRLTYSAYFFIKDRDLFLVIYNSTTTLEIKHMSFYVAFLFYCITVTQQDKLSWLALEKQQVSQT